VLGEPRRGDWDHVRRNIIRGSDVLCAVFSTADRASLAELERIMQVEVKKLAVDVPIVLIGNKTDLRDSRRPQPVVGHAQPGSQGYLTPCHRQEFNCVSFLEGKEAAARMGAVRYEETSGFNPEKVADVFATAAQYGLMFRNPQLSAPQSSVEAQETTTDTSIDREYAMYAEERCQHLSDYMLEPRRSNDRVLEDVEPTATATSGSW